MQVDRQQLDVVVVVDQAAEPVDHDETLARFLLAHVRRQRSEAISTTSST